MNLILVIINMALYVAVTVLLIQEYRRTRHPGLLWLAVPLVLLPLLGMPLIHGVGESVDKLAAGQVTGAFPFTLVETGLLTLGGLLAAINGAEHIVWSSFVLVSVLVLRQPRGRAPDQRSRP